MRGLLDEVKEDPPQVDGAVESKQRVRRSAPALVSKAWNFQTRRRTDDVLCAQGLLPVRTDDLRACDLGVEPELLVAGWKFRAQIATLDPAPFHVRQVVDDADDRKQSVLRRPAELLLAQVAGGRDDLVALPSDESEQELALIRRRGW